MPEQADVISNLLNRSLDGALRDLRFFGRDDAGRRGKQTPSQPSASDESNDTATWSQESLPPRIEKVLNELFTQLAEAFDDASSVREVVGLIAQISICRKSLGLAVERWPLRTSRSKNLHNYLFKVVVACLAPGPASLLHRNGAIRRLGPAEHANLRGGEQFRDGIATLEACVLLEHFNQHAPAAVLKDMQDVISELPHSRGELNDIGKELWRLDNDSDEGCPCFEELRSLIATVTGELSVLQGCRNALHELIDLVNRGIRDQATLKPMAVAASKSTGRADQPSREAEKLLELAIISAGSVTLLEIEPGGIACEACYTSLPTGVRSKLNDSTIVRTCQCGAWLVRSLTK